MFKYLFKTWKNNHGPLLLSMAIAAAICMSCVSYFNILPDVQLIDNAGRAFQRPAEAAAQNRQVNVVITGPIMTPEMSRAYHGWVLVLPTGKVLDNLAEPLISSPFKFGHTGVGYTRVEVADIDRHAIVAFLDLNDNQQIDFDSRGQPIEPLRFANAASPPKSLELTAEQLTPPTEQDAFHIVHFAFHPSHLDNGKPLPSLGPEPQE